MTKPLQAKTCIGEEHQTSYI